MNFTPSFSVNGMQQMNQWPSPNKLTGNGAASGGQVVGILQAGENGINYLRTIDSNSLQAAATATATSAPTVITLPIQLPTDKPGDPPQTVQIQVLPQMPTLAQQQQQQQQHHQQQQQMSHNQKYQMTQIPVQALNQNATLLWCTPQSSDGNTVQLQIADHQHGLPENVTLVTALQSADLQLLQAAAGGTGTAANTLQKIDKSDPDPIPISLIKAEASSPQHHADDGNQNDSMDWNSGGGGQTANGQQQQQQQQQRQQNRGTHDGDDDDETHDENLANDFISLQSFLKFNNTPSSIKQEVIPINENGDDSLKINEDNPEGTETGPGGQDGEENDPKSKRKKKYKKKPPKPKKPKPGQVQIATAVDGTILFCCPECHMAYPDKEMLEQHLVMHKIERRFICDICGAGLKRKEHLERHKMGHSPERPFICNVCTKGFKRKEHLNLHVVIHSGQKTEICGDCGKGFYRKDHLRKHVRSHLMRRMKEDLNQQNNSNNSGGTSAAMATATAAAATAAAAAAASGANATSAATFNGISLLSNLQSQIHHVTIQMPSSQMQLPVQIQVPQHEIKVDSSLNDSNSLNSVSTVVLPTAEETNAMAMLSPNSASGSHHRSAAAAAQQQQQEHQHQQHLQHQQHTENLILERHIQQQHAKMNQAQQKDSQTMSIDQQQQQQQQHHHLQHQQHQQYSTNMHTASLNNNNNNNNNSNNKNNNDIQMKENYNIAEQ